MKATVSGTHDDVVRMQSVNSAVTIPVRKTLKHGCSAQRRMLFSYSRACRAVVLIFLVFLTASCSSHKAVIDRSAMEKILWPGPPEQPRISFLWSVSALSGGIGGRASDIFAGDEDTTDPQSSRRLLGPYGIFVDEKGLLYITDPGAYRLTIIDPKDGSVRNITAAGGEDFLSPIGIVVFRDRIFVSDSRLRKVFILDASGKPAGTFEGDFGRPTALALDAERELIYVTDTPAHRVYQYTTEGKRLGSIGKNGSGGGEFNFPTHLWVDRKGKLFVTDSLNFRVQIFSPDGSWEGMFGMLGDAYGDLEKPKGVATDSDGNVYVVDSIKDMVKIFSRDGALLLFFGSQGRAYGEFWLPSGIFIDNNDYIYVTDTYNGRVQVFKYLGKRKDRVVQ